MTLFEKIVARQIPAEILHEDAVAIAIRDIQPQAPTHILVIPKRPIANLHDATEDDRDTLGHLLLVARSLADRLDLHQRGYRVVINCGPDAGESVPHLHVHLLAGRPLHWPPG